VATTVIALACQVVLFYRPQSANLVSDAYKPVDGELWISRSLGADPAAEEDPTTTEAHFKLFGGMSSLKLMIASVSVIIIVCAVQIVEYIFHSLHLLTHDTPFYQMVQSIEKELMVVGFTAFIFKIIVNTTSFLALDWFHSLEYAGMPHLRAVTAVVLAPCFAAHSLPSPSVPAQTS
jgi:hypothetical protein